MFLQFGVLFESGVALELERQRKFVGLLGEIDLKDRVFLDLLGVGDFLVGVGDDRVDFGDQVSVIRLGRVAELIADRINLVGIGRVLELEAHSASLRQDTQRITRDYVKDSNGHDIHSARSARCNIRCRSRRADNPRRR